MQVEIMFFLEERATTAGRAACGLFDRKAKIEYDTKGKLPFNREDDPL